MINNNNVTNPDNFFGFSNSNCNLKNKPLFCVTFITVYRREQKHLFVVNGHKKQEIDKENAMVYIPIQKSTSWEQRAKPIFFQFFDLHSVTSCFLD